MICQVHFLALPHGLEPRLTGPKPVVLPLDEGRLWWRPSDLNRVPSRLQRDALPHELGRLMAGSVGVEPTYSMLTA